MSVMANTSYWLKLTNVCFTFRIGLSWFSDPCSHSGTQTGEQPLFQILPVTMPKERKL